MLFIVFELLGLSTMSGSEEELSSEERSAEELSVEEMSTNLFEAMQEKVWQCFLDQLIMAVQQDIDRNKLETKKAWNTFCFEMSHDYINKKTRCWSCSQLGLLVFG